MQRRYEDFRALGVEVIAVSGASVEDHAALAQKIAAKFPILSDADGETIRAFGVHHPDAVPFIEQSVARPAIFLVDPEGIVRARYLTDNWRIRPHEETLFTNVQKLISAAGSEGSR